MRALPILILAIAGAAMPVVAVAQTRAGAPTPQHHQQAPSTTNGQAPSETNAQAPSEPNAQPPSGPVPSAPVGHRQPRAGDVPSGVGVSPLDQQLDQDLQICRRC
jgi:hypothetical protein